MPDEEISKPVVPWLSFEQKLNTSLIPTITKQDRKKAWAKIPERKYVFKKVEKSNIFICKITIGCLLFPFIYRGKNGGHVPKMHPFSFRYRNGNNWQSITILPQKCLYLPPFLKIYKSWTHLSPRVFSSIFKPKRHGVLGGVFLEKWSLSHQIFIQMNI